MIYGYIIPPLLGSRGSVDPLLTLQREITEREALKLQVIYLVVEVAQVLSIIPEPILYTFMAETVLIQRPHVSAQMMHST